MNDFELNLVNAYRAKDSGSTEAEMHFLEKCMELYEPGVCTEELMIGIMVRLLDLCAGEVINDVITDAFPESRTVH